MEERQISQQPTLLLTIIKDWLPVATVVGSALFGLYSYLEQKSQQADKDRTARLIEVQKPYIERRIKIYFATVQVAGKLASLEKSQGEWQQAKLRYMQLFWSELAFVASDQVVIAMNVFRNALTDYEGDFSEAHHLDLGKAAHSLSKNIRDDIKKSWVVAPVPQ